MSVAYQRTSKQRNQPDAAEMLSDFTKFHIGLYAAIVALMKVPNVSVDWVLEFIAVFLIGVAGVCAGIVCFSYPEWLETRTLKSFLDMPTGPGSAKSNEVERV